MKKILLSLFLLALNPAWAEGSERRIIKRTAVGQIRIEQRGTIVPEPATSTQPPQCNPPDEIYRLANGCPCNNPNCNSNDGGGSQSDPIEVQQLRMIISAIPAGQFQGEDRLGIYYNPNRQISSNNPVRIYNLKTGGYFSAYFDSAGFLRTSIGTVPNSVNGIAPLPSSQRVDISRLNFQDSAVLETIYGDPGHSNIKITETDEVNIDMLPRFRKRYGTITRTTLINGIYMPAGSIVIGTRYDGVARPDLNDMSDLRVYSPEGVLINVIPEKDFSSLDCGTVSRAQCFDFQSHYTDQSTYDFGAKVFAEYNTASFFPGMNAQQANRLWLDIQKDLEANTVLDINSGNEPWQERIFKDLNKQEQTYIKNLLTNQVRIKTLEEMMGYRQTNRFMQFVAKNNGQADFEKYCREADLVSTEADLRDAALEKAYDNMFCKLNDFSNRKLEKWEARDKFNNASNKNKAVAKTDFDIAINQQDIAHAAYNQARQAYNQELKYGAEKRKESGATSVEDTGDEPTTVVDDGIPVECTKKQNRDKPKCRQYYDAPPRCINNNGYLKKNDQTCHGYKSPGFAPESQAQTVAKPAPKVEPKVQPVPKPEPKTTPAPKPVARPKAKPPKKQNNNKKKK